MAESDPFSIGEVVEGPELDRLVSRILPTAAVILEPEEVPASAAQGRSSQDRATELILPPGVVLPPPAL